MLSPLSSSKHNLAVWNCLFDLKLMKFEILQSINISGKPY